MPAVAATTVPAPTSPLARPPGPGGLAPSRVALLLPLSGAQRPVAEAIRDGFMAAWLADTAAGRPEVVVLDEEKPGAASAYGAAIAGGAGAVVGPLLKESVAQVLPAAGTVPTLALNYADGPVFAPPGFLQFALAPEDEARLVAERAAADGRLRALALVPDTEWGRRMLAAFTPALESLGGRVLASRFYDPAATDHTAQLQGLLLLDESRARHRQLVANAGIPLEFEPRRRTDADLIFLAANVAAGRLIRPQLRFLYAGDIPTYATSAIYQPGSAGDADLDGIMFPDAPALLGAEPRAEALRGALARRWPQGAVARMRFYAMGFDAYGLLAGIGAPGAAPFAGLSGELQADAGGRIRRRMPWAEFRDGRIVPLPASLPAVAADPATTAP